MPSIFAVDIGGTFTDLVACDIDTGAVSFAKSPTTYGSLSDGIFACIAKAKARPGDAVMVKHGTTLVINALLQRAGSRTALITTEGFRDVLEIGRGNRTEPFNLRFRRDGALIPRELRFELPERMSANGEVKMPLDMEELDRLAERLAALGVEAVAISFLNSYANPEHERAAAAHLRARLPAAFVSVGTELTREWFEFERTATAAANAYVGPKASAYVGEFDRQLRAGGFAGSLLLMGSHGGALSADRVLREPIALVESGPVGGCIGAAAFADSLGLANVIAFDMGGTTAKCALIERGRFSVESTYYVGGFQRGFPIRGNVVDILEVGAGGGSIAWLDSQKRLNVGPRSAGSEPGPVCYGRGGAEPTVTDAHLVLGRLDAGHFLGGDMALDLAGARAAIAERIAAPLGFDGEGAVTRAAAGIITLADVAMADAIKQISIARGRDPRDFALFCYGGGGPLHGVELARELHIPRVIVPPEPGNFSALGMLLADARLDDTRILLAGLDATAMQKMRALYADIEARSRAALEAEFGPRPVTFERKAELRYRGQKHSLKIAVPDGSDADALRAVFDVEYRRRYGYTRPNTAVEFVAVSATATLSIARPDVARLHQNARHAPGPPRRRAIYTTETESFVDAAIYDRYALPVGFAAPGPAIVEEYGSSTLVGPRDRFEIGPLGEIRIDCLP